MSPSRPHRTVAPFVLVAAVLAFTASDRIVSAQSPPRAEQSAGNQVDVLIGFADEPGPADEETVRAAGGQVKHRFHLVNAIAASVAEQAIEGLRHNPHITAIEPDVRIVALDAELDNSWGVARIGAGVAHQSDIRGAGVKVAILDTGIDYNHPDLAGNYVGGHDFVNNDDDPMDDNGHGTHVAGTVAARDNGLGVVGVAPEAKLYALKVLDATGNGTFSSVIAAVQWAVDNGVQVTNNSYGSDEDPGDIVKTAFDNAEAAGILSVASAGNSGTCAGTGDNVGYPARYASVMAVAATDNTDSSPCFSSTGPDVEISAPGVSVNSTAPGGSYRELSGTSMASPHVAGTAALLFGQGIADANHNGHVNDEIRDRLISTAHDLGTTGRDTWYGYGLVDALAATGAPGVRDPEVTVALTTDKSSYVKGTDSNVQLTIVVTDEDGDPIVGLPSTAFVTMLDGGNATVTFTPTGTNGRYTGSLSIASKPTGSHAVNVTVTDARQVSGTDSATFTLAHLLQVKSIGYATTGGAKKNLTVTVSVVNEANAPVSRATISIRVARNGVAYAAGDATNTNNAGLASFDFKNAPSGCYVTTVYTLYANDYLWDGKQLANNPPFCK